MRNIKAYNEEWINNRYILKKMENWKNSGLINSKKFIEVTEKHQVGYTYYNIFAKIGLFIFSWIALSAITSLVALIVFPIIDESEIVLKTLSIVSSLLLFAFLEVLIKKGSFYRSGPDNLLMYVAISSFIFALFFVLGFNLKIDYYLLIATIVLLGGCIRYGDPFLSFALFAVLTGFIFTTVTKSEIGKVIVPFVLMFLAALIYFANDKWITSIYYHSTHKVFKTCALVLFYVSGNYFLVREGNALLANLPESIEISMPWIFWFFTFGIPVFYLTFAIRFKDRLVLHLGILGIVASIITFRYYYHILPLEIVISIIGLCLIVFTMLLSHWLKTERRGIVSNETKGNKNTEILLINELIQSNLGNNPNQDGFEFGGGNFGGGGAGSEY
jgi:hypothetical protein